MTMFYVWSVATTLFSQSSKNRVPWMQKSAQKSRALRITQESIRRVTRGAARAKSDLCKLYPNSDSTIQDVFLKWAPCATGVCDKTFLLREPSRPATQWRKLRMTYLPTFFLHPRSTDITQYD